MCPTQTRQKRAVDDSINIFGAAGSDEPDESSPTFEYDDIKMFVVHQIWTNGWNQSAAEAFCKYKVENSHAGLACSRLQNVEFSTAISNCVLDILVGYFIFAYYKVIYTIALS